MNGVIIAGGGRGLMFAEVIALDKEIKKLGVKVMALVDTNKSIHPKLRRSLNEFGLPETQVLSSLEEALNVFTCKESQSVFIVTPNPTHAKLTRMALDAGRHVFLEKPIAANWADAVDIVNAAGNSNKMVYMGLLLRYSRYYKWIREIITAGTLGNLVMVQMNERLDVDHSSAYRRGWRRLKANSGGLMNEKCSHDIDILCWLKESQGKPIEVFSYGGDHMFPKKGTPSDKCSECNDKTCPFRIKNLEEFNDQRYTHSANLDIYNTCTFKTDANVHTHQSMTVIFSDGTQGLFNITLYSADPDRDIIIHGTEGYLAGSLNSGKFTVQTYRDNKTTVYDTGIKNNQHGGADSDVTREFFHAIMDSGAPEAKVIDAATASRIAFAADLSVQEGRKVALNEFPY